MSELEALVQMEYPGRFIIVGKNGKDEPTVCYGVTGRSPPSQARTFAYDPKTQTVRTEVTDKSQLEKGSAALLLYPAVAHYKKGVVVSNGAQTKLLFTSLKNKLDGLLDGFMEQYEGASRAVCADVMDEALKHHAFEYDAKESRWIDIASYEPDEPNWTPRINGVTTGNAAVLSIVKKIDNRRVMIPYAISLETGKARVIATYTGENKNPLPSFNTDPFSVELPWETPEEITSAVFNSLRPDMRVCVATMCVGESVRTARIDRHTNEMKS